MVRLVVVHHQVIKPGSFRDTDDSTTRLYEYIHGIVETSQAGTGMENKRVYRGPRLLDRLAFKQWIRTDREALTVLCKITRSRLDF